MKSTIYYIYQSKLKVNFCCSNENMGSLLFYCFLLCFKINNQKINPTRNNSSNSNNNCIIFNNNNSNYIFLLFYSLSFLSIIKQRELNLLTIYLSFSSFFFFSKLNIVCKCSGISNKDHFWRDKTRISHSHRHSRNFF